MHVDLVSALTAPDRDAALARLSEGPVVKTANYFDGTRVHLVTGYDEILAVLSDPRFSHDPAKQTKLAFGSVAGLPEDVQPYIMSALGVQDPPRHTHLRRAVSREFTFRRVERLRPRIQQITDELLDDLPREGDLVEHLAYPLPVRVICELLGVPVADYDRWHQWSQAMGGGDREAMATGSRALVAYILELVDAKRRDPGEDLISALVRNDELTIEEITSLALSILLAGHATTVMVISGGVLLLMTHPEQKRPLLDDPERIPDAVEEFLRFGGAADIGVFRYTLEPVEIGGVTIPADEPVLPIYFAGNRDPRRFDHPTELRLDRGDTGHLGFGHGMHFCLGAALARAELRTVFTTLLERYPDLALLAPEAPPASTRGLTELWVRLY